MAAAGLLGLDERVELIEGEIIDRAPIGSRHAACVNRLNRLLVTRLGDRAIVSVQNSVRLGDLSEPQPDLAVLAPCRTSTPRTTPVRPMSCSSWKWAIPPPAGTGL